MDWINLGTIDLDTNWRSFDQPVLGYDTFRITQIAPTQFPNAFYLAQRFEIGTDFILVTPWRRLIYSSEPQLIELPIPRSLLDKGYVVYTMLGKARLPLFQQPWSVTIEALV